MKKIIILCSFMLLCMQLPTYSQYKEVTIDPAKQYAANKVAQFGKLKRTGFTMLGVGGAVTIVSIVVIARADWYEDPYTGTYTTDDVSAAYAILGTVYVGVPLIIGGTVLSIIGNYKEKSYMRKFENLDVSYFKMEDAHGLRLAYSF
ncbi:hypothetical protein N6H18_06145 [Reichenbachiella agarivorans]|uniref:Uncharacterized protein n=1 Tax=Reichenbachiella agarivorans TaxID=2979464 RepID=A0ABY6CVN5_9BACT|nr:hypothetical protein [Reichenbachiella agarivorans]UXP33533.1 hypothetical protein N6H18_06145 [Reichenbachiella agarivorans]